MTPALNAPLDGLDGIDGLADLRATHEDLTERTYRALRDLIVARAIAPGTKMAAEGLSQRFGVSRTTIKGALDQLAAEGLVVVRPQVGTFVRGLTDRDVREIWDVRLMIETHAVRTGVYLATAEQRGELWSIVEQMAPLVVGREYQEDDYLRSVDLDRRLHALIVETADNAHLLGVHRPIAVYVHIASFRSRQGLRRADEGLKEHHEIAAAYDQRDAGRAVAALTRHVERSRDVILTAIARTGGLL